MPVLIGACLQVHPEHGRAALGISDKLLRQHDDGDTPLAFWQLTCPASCLLRTVALRVLSGKAAALGVERLWSYARVVLTDNRRSMLTSRLMQLLQVKMNGNLLEGERLSTCAKQVAAMLDDGASFESIFDDLAQFEEEEQAERAADEGADELLSDVEAPVAAGTKEDAVAVVDIFDA